jgi:hypothetical protein
MKVCQRAKSEKYEKGKYFQYKYSMFVSKHNAVLGYCAGNGY